MAQRQGIVLGPVESVNRYAKVQTNGTICKSFTYSLKF
jgi:hypothetical protein